MNDVLCLEDICVEDTDTVEDTDIVDDIDTDCIVEDKETKEDDGKEYHLEGPDFRQRTVKDKENDAVVKFQKNNDPNLLVKIYEDRIPTLNYWARKNKYLEQGNDYKDIRSELTRIFMKAINQYQFERTCEGRGGQEKVIQTDFNTYLYTSFNYALYNIYNKGNAKKRTFISEDGEVFRSSHSTLSLDYVYGNNDNGMFTLREMVSDQQVDNVENAIDKMRLNEIMDFVAGGSHTYIYDFLKKVGEGSSITSLIKKLKTVNGKVSPDPEVLNRINNSRRKPVRIVSDLISQKVDKRFKLIDFEVKNTCIHYTIEMHKTEETDNILKRIRQLKRQKDFYIKNIKNI